MPSKSKINIADVARQAGVAVSTVSRVINDGPVSVAVRNRVQKVMADLDFSPSRRARNLRMGTAGALGLLVPHIGAAWLSRVIEGIEEECARRKVSMLISSTGMEPLFRTDVVRWWIDDNMVDGLVLTSPGVREKNLVEVAAKEGLGLVFIGSDYDFGVGQLIRSDNAEGGLKLARHLLRLGHKKIQVMSGGKTSCDSSERFAGLRDGLAIGGVDLRESDVHHGGWMFEDGQDYARLWLKLNKKDRGTAVVGVNDSMALGFLFEVQKAGLKVPDDVSVAGFDDVPAAGRTFPGLTTVSQHLDIFGAAAARSILEQREGKDNSQREPLHFKMDLVERGSTGHAK